MTHIRSLQVWRTWQFTALFFHLSERHCEAVHIYDKCSPANELSGLVSPRREPFNSESIQSDTLLMRWSRINVSKGHILYNTIQSGQAMVRMSEVMNVLVMYNPDGRTWLLISWSRNVVDTDYSTKMPFFSTALCSNLARMGQKSHSGKTGKGFNALYCALLHPVGLYSLQHIHPHSDSRTN